MFFVYAHLPKLYFVFSSFWALLSELNHLPPFIFDHQTRIWIFCVFEHFLASWIFYDTPFESHFFFVLVVEISSRSLLARTLIINLTLIIGSCFTLTSYVPGACTNNPSQSVQCLGRRLDFRCVKMRYSCSHQKGNQPRYSPPRYPADTAQTRQHKSWWNTFTSHLHVGDVL
jgi:hypothetical protein